MKISDVSVPEVYKESGDFRFFLKWFEDALTKVHYDTENLPDLYDPTRCPEWLLWMLADTMGFKFDDRLPVAFNRLVLMYFMSMIRNKGSKDGVTLAAETNLAQFNIIEYGKEKEILNNRLEDTSIPVNSVYVTPHVKEGYVDVVYFSTKKPIDACIEYVRPVGMYLAQYAGVRFDARDKISIDARLTNTNDLGVSIGPTFVGHYSRKDYASMQKIKDKAAFNKMETDPRDTVKFNPASGKTKREQFQATKRKKYQKSDYTKYGNSEDGYTRDDVWYRNNEYEDSYTPNDSSPWINPGLRAMYSLQLCNNEHIVDSLLDPIFGLGYLPQKDIKDGTKYAKDPKNVSGSKYTQSFTADGKTDTFIIIRDIQDVEYIRVNGEDVSGTKTGKRSVTLDKTPKKGDTVQVRYVADYILPDTVDLATQEQASRSWWAQGIANGSIQVSTHYPGKYPNAWNLRYDQTRDMEQGGTDVYTFRNVDDTPDVVTPRPAVNPIMSVIGDAISMNTRNDQYIVKDEQSGELEIHNVEPDGQITDKVTDVSDIDKD